MEVKIILNLSAADYARIQNHVESLLPEGHFVEDMQQITQDIMQRFVNHQVGEDSHESMGDLIELWLENYGDANEDIVFDQMEEIKRPLHEVLQVGTYYNVFNVYTQKKEPMEYLGYYASEYVAEEDKNNPDFFTIRFKAVHPRKPNEFLTYGPSDDQIDIKPLKDL